MQLIFKVKQRQDWGGFLDFTWFIPNKFPASFNLLKPEFFQSVFDTKHKIGLIIYRLIDASLIGIFLMIPSYKEIKILVNEEHMVVLGVTGLRHRGTVAIY